jgi:transposase-like protein
VFNDLKTRGVEDVLIAVSDGLKGIPESLAAAYPEAILQTCIVHLIRNSLDYARWKDRKCVAAALRPIYTAPSAEAAQAALTAFEQSESGTKLPHVATSWRRAWEYVTPFLPSRPRFGGSFTPPMRLNRSTRALSSALYEDPSVLQSTFEILQTTPPHPFGSPTIRNSEIGRSTIPYGKEILIGQPWLYCG